MFVDYNLYRRPISRTAIKIFKTSELKFNIYLSFIDLNSTIKALKTPERF